MEQTQSVAIVIIVKLVKLEEFVDHFKIASLMEYANNVQLTYMEIYAYSLKMDHKIN